MSNIHEICKNFDFRLIFEKSKKNSFKKCHDLPENITRSTLDIPELSEPEVIRHYTNLSKINFGIDTGMYPLGSCTMKYNPRFTEHLSDHRQNMVHPHQDESTIQGSLKIMYLLKKHLMNICAMDDFSLQPAAGAQGEFTAMAMIKAYFERKNDFRNEVIVPDSAHGTNPKSAAMAGFDAVEIQSDEKGFVDLEILRSAVSEKTAAFMLTSPNTLGLFEKNILEIAGIVHGAGGLLFYDGANLNGIIGKVRPGDMGFDCMSLNLHKTFAVPHGGGGPGGGPIGVKKHLADFLPVPTVEYDGQKYCFDHDRPDSIGKVHIFHGNYLSVLKALGYIKRSGSAGMMRMSEFSVLNSNYMVSKLSNTYEIKNPEIQRKHEAVFSAARQKKNDITALDIAKRLIDYGIHPPTIYFPLVIKEALMIEPAETESKESIDNYCNILIRINDEAGKNPEIVKTAPHTSIVGRLDDVFAARKMILSWRANEDRIDNKSHSRNGRESRAQRYG
ncbi:MAG TPA: aminomethyl-transferring glycine dehydrogenase subunit GcvPB [Candidatus Methylomirabilis sp.]|nr:aminomethyl-transferring glycine dehydrogenase subunit GcvPB [Candidatus Methylomirabilis sp.]